MWEACGIASFLRNMWPGLALSTGNGAVASNAESLNLSSRYRFKAGICSSVAGYGSSEGRLGGTRRSSLARLLFVWSET